MACKIRPALGSSTMTVSHWRGRESHSGSVLRAGSLSRSNQVPKPWKIPRELLVYSLHGHPEGVGSNTGEGILQDQGR